MKATYETLDEYLGDPGAIKEQIAEKTRGMTTKQVLAYFAGTPRRLREATGRKLRVRRAPRKRPAAKRGTGRSLVSGRSQRRGGS